MSPATRTGPSSASTSSFRPTAPRVGSACWNCAASQKCRAHARMSLTQQLLLRALVARFWEEPYKGQPVPWGTQLHDRFLLPHFCEQDFNDVVRRPQGVRLSVQDGVVRAAPGIPFPAPGRGHLRRGHHGTAHRAGTVACPRRRRYAGRHSPLRRFFRRETAGQSGKRH